MLNVVYQIHLNQRFRSGDGIFHCEMLWVYLARRVKLFQRPNCVLLNEGWSAVTGVVLSGISVGTFSPPELGLVMAVWDVTNPNHSRRVHHHHYSPNLYVIITIAWANRGFSCVGGQGGTWRRTCRHEAGVGAL
jgi:hypothetical protein